MTDPPLSPALATRSFAIPAAHRGAQAPKALDLQQLADRTRNARNLGVQKRMDGVGNREVRTADARGPWALARPGVPPGLST